MKTLLTIDEVMNSTFYQMPKSFFRNPTYTSMRCESKIAYMLLVDLLPLSVQNNWTNEKREVYVKLSRTNLMALLGIKGTQKATQIMKELADHKLIINKQIGLTKCNQIFIYPLDGEPPLKRGQDKPKVTKAHTPKPVANKSTTKKPQETKSKQTQLQETSNPITPHTPASAPSLEDAIDEVQNLLDNQIHLEDLKQQYDPGFVDEIGNNICEMFLNTHTRIGQQDKPMSIMRGVIRKLKIHHIEHVIEQFREVSANTVIFNPKRYLQTMIYNAIYEANTKILGHIRYHLGYC